MIHKIDIEQLLMQIDILLQKLRYNLFTKVDKFNIVIQQDINDCYGDPISDARINIFIGEKELYNFDFLYGKLDYYDPVVSNDKLQELKLLHKLLEDRVKQKKG
jgi:hypothetical protein